jgi:hypothetical protein
MQELFGENYNLPKATWVGADRWLVVASTWRKAADGKPSESNTRAWWLDVDAGKLTPIEGFSGQHARHVAAAHDGGFVVVVDPPPVEVVVVEVASAVVVVVEMGGLSTCPERTGQT